MIHMKCDEILEKLEEDFPSDAALEWDNPGLLAGSRYADVNTVYVALDATDAVIDDAISKGAQLIVTHHPMIFSPIRHVTDDDRIGRRLIKLLEHQVECFAMHTNFDVCKMAELNEQQLSLKNTCVLMETGQRNGAPEGIGRVGLLPESMTLAECAAFVKRAMELPYVITYGDAKREMRIAAVSGGSGKSMVHDAIRLGADVLITGDIDYHTAIDAVSDGLCVIDAGHYGTEYCFIEYTAAYLKKAFPSLTVLSASVSMPGRAE
jgi:dinuclear metal center YbgI/SA1388 family protein